jgi:hypothetical protein
MHEIYDLKEMLCKELEEYGKKGDLTAGSLDVVDKLAHTIKNLDKIIESYEENGEYSSRGGSYAGGMGMGGASYERGGRSYRGGNMGGRSYARGRGRNARRDAMGRYSTEGYSRNDEMIEQLNDLMDDAPDERTRAEIQKFITKLEGMM